MASLNKVHLIGNVGRDPDVRFMPDGNAVANVALATSRSWKGKDGGKHEETEWHRLTFYGKLAEIVQQYVTKGRAIYVEGRLHTRKWQDKDGSDRYTTEIICDQMQLLGGRDDAGGGDNRPQQRGNDGSDQWNQARSQSSTSGRQPARQGQREQGTLDDMADDIPF